MYDYEVFKEYPDETAAILRASFKDFIKFFHPYLRHSAFIFHDCHKQIINKLQAIADGENEKPNLAISICPRIGKSEIVKYFIAWSFARKRSSKFIYTSYSDRLIFDFSGNIRNLIQSELYQKIFGIELRQDSQSKQLWNIEDGGGLLASPLGGGITGFGAGGMDPDFSGAVIMDDVLKADDYKSEAARKNCVDYYDMTLTSRVEQKGKTPFICIMQRLHVDDLIGYLQKKEADKWDFLELPALLPDGSSIFPEKLPVEYLKELEKTKPYVFNSQYQQKPIVLGGGVFKTEWWRFYNDYSDDQFSQIFITADTAMATNQWNDYTAAGVWGLTVTNKLYLLDMIHGKFEAPELKSMFLNLWQKWRQGVNGRPLSAVIVENKASGTGLIQELRRGYGIPILPIIPEKDKLTRVEDIIGFVASGLVYLPKNENNLVNEFLSEAEAFSRDMSHTHDDIIDMTVYAINHAYNRKGLF